MDSIHGNSGEYHQPLLTEPGSNHEESKPEENKWRDEDGEEGLKYKAMDRNKEAMGHRRTFNHQSCNSCCFYSMNIITQAFAGHLGDVQLVAISIANTAIVGFNFGLIGWRVL
ncbi:protein DETOXIFICATION 27-like isoform X2 [Gossypium raimondii]|uniref:protein DETOXIFICATION 27-like isoform X2 n=1 Tax=Gossypium raimondii TaxID=29730 RepID=UPI00227B0345|nr:protein DETOXIFICATION 27-like isoform X2 [Gossypium raimondii]